MAESDRKEGHGRKENHKLFRVAGDVVHINNLSKLQKHMF